MDIISTDLGLIMSIFVATHFLKVNKKIAKLMFKKCNIGMGWLPLPISSRWVSPHQSEEQGFPAGTGRSPVLMTVLMYWDQDILAKIFIIISCRPDCRTPQSFHRLQTCKTYSAQHHCWTTCVINLPEVYLTLSSRFSSGPSPIYPCHSLTNCCLVDLFDVMRKRE